MERAMSIRSNRTAKDVRTSRAIVAVAVAAVVGAIALCAAATANAAQATWPRKIDTDRGTLTIYQPQPEKLDDNMLEGRAAASIKSKTAKEPTFGVIWFTAHVDTDRDAGTAVLRDIVVTQVRWPDSKPIEEEDVRAFLTTLMPKQSIPISLEQLKASLVTIENQKKSMDDLRHDPPKIIFKEEIAVLLLYDGEPRTLPIPNTDFEQVANSALAVVKDKKTGTYYLAGGQYLVQRRRPEGSVAVDRKAARRDREADPAAGCVRIAEAQSTADDRRRDRADRADLDGRAAELADDRERRAALHREHRDARGARRGDERQGVRAARGALVPRGNHRRARGPSCGRTSCRRLSRTSRPPRRSARRARRSPVRPRPRTRCSTRSCRRRRRSSATRRSSR